MIIGRWNCLTGALLAAGLGVAAAAAPEVPTAPKLKIAAAARLGVTNNVQIQAATLAGTRIVAVGERGVVLLSDDSGMSYRQARTVPIASTLTAVTFVDTRIGWAVGHWGAILKTSDGGETWTLQRSDTSVDRPLFSVYFKNAEVGWAVGLWSLMLHTVDGGSTWRTVELPLPPKAKKADRSLYAIFGDATGSLFVACEQGYVLRSSNAGSTWSYLETGHRGSFWGGVALRDGVVLVGGLRGAIYRSVDGGGTWQVAKTPYRSSLTSIVQLGDDSIVAVGLDGVMLESRDGGVTFTGKQRAERSALTAIVDAGGAAPLLFATSGPVRR